MTSQFFIVLLCAVALPVALSKLLRIEKLFPLVSLQLMMGLSIHLTGFDAWLRAKHSIDLQHGELAYSFYGLAALAASLLVALTGASAVPHEAGWQKWRFVPISVVGFFTTCAVGSVIGYALSGVFPGLAGANAGRPLFSVAVGLSLAVSALPVLAGVLRDLNLAGTGLAKLAMNCAVLDDLWMWISVAVILAMTSSHGHPLQVIMLLGVYVAAMLCVVRPMLKRLFLLHPRMKQADRILISMTIILASAIATDAIGLHWVLGAFVGGSVLPARALTGWRDSLMHLNQTLLVPFFFILTGLRLDIDAGSPSFWALTAVLTVGAVAVKSCSVALISRATGLKWQQSFLLGSLLQCKGFMELVTINIFLDAGVISHPIFAALVTMAMASTFITVPAIRILSSRKAASPRLGPHPAK